MALHVHRDRIHRDVRRRELDVDGERRRVAAQPLRPDRRAGSPPPRAPPRAPRPRDRRSACPSGRVAATLARCTHRSAVPPTPTPTIVGGQVLPPASSTQSTTKVLIASTPSAGIAIFSHELFSEPLPFGIISMREPVEGVGEVDVDHRHADAARRVLVLARERMHDRRAQRILARRALAAAADRRLQRRRRRPRRRGRSTTL